MEDVSTQLREEMSAEWKRHNERDQRDYMRERQRAFKEKKYRVSYPTWWLCDVCSKPISGNRIHLDHDHKTGKFRGWLCPGCNIFLGHLEKSGFNIERFITYLRERV